MHASSKNTIIIGSSASNRLLLLLRCTNRFRQAIVSQCNDQVTRELKAWDSLFSTSIWLFLSLPLSFSFSFSVNHQCALICFHFNSNESNVTKKLLYMEEADAHFAQCNIITGIRIVRIALFSFGEFCVKKNHLLN